MQHRETSSRLQHNEAMCILQKKSRISITLSLKYGGLGVFTFRYSKSILEYINVGGEK